MRNTWILLLALASTLALSACGGDNPQEVAEQYLRAGAAQDQARIRELLDPACHSDEAMTRVDAARVMGVPMTLTEVTVTPGEQADESASVSYTLAGSAHGEGGRTEFLGVEVRTGVVNVDNANQSGTLRLRKVDGNWRVTCASAGGS